MSEFGAPDQYDSLSGVADSSETPVLFGHQGQSRFLAGAYRSGKMPHALLFGGPRGVGKATLAFQLVSHLLRHPNPDTAPEAIEQLDISTPLFRRIAGRAHPGLLHLTRPWDEKGKKFKTAITVEEVRSIARFVGLTAHDGGYRAAIVDSADDMNRNAANALLKNLEEPPAKTVFILISHAPGRLLPTIRSRCQYIRFDRLAESDVGHVLDAMPEGIDPRLRNEAIAKCGGSAREAILLAQFGGLEIGNAVREFVARQRFDPTEANRISGAVAARGNDVQFELFNNSVLDLVSSRARDAAISGDKPAAIRLSRMWEETSRQIGEAAAFNLDRKQHVLSLLANLNMTMQS
jgi:DNA polymerase-3 subunit delta'